MQIHNDYEIDLYNGDVGQVLDICADGTVRVEMNGEEHRIPAANTDGLTLAYAITTHNGQGSEFPVVLVPLHLSNPAAYKLLERQLLYTAVSRARRTCVLAGEWRAFLFAVRRDPPRRLTMLRSYLRSAEPIPVANLSAYEDDDF